MVFERPKRPGKKGNSQPNQGQDSRRGNNRNPDEPSPWLQHPLDPEPRPDRTASFIEYLRWMRSPDSEYKDPTKVQILQLAEEKANYRQRLQVLADRTQLIAGKENCFQVKCVWRLRVGGHRGPESILLPAFDPLGMPYIPSSTLRGVARTQAIREVMAERNLRWEDAERAIAPYFGSLEATGSDRAGKVIFLDAYPLPQPSGANGGLAVDMANNIWSWDAAGRELLYSPNPNPFFSLLEPTFLIGVRPTANCNPETLEQVKRWLIQGLQSGIGSQVNTGYGSLVRAGRTAFDSFFEVKFSLQGQLIHGRQKFTQWHWNDRRREWQMRGNPEAEVRAVAFKSMLRYWFRAFALGVLPAPRVKELEACLFGSINPQARGWVCVRVAEGKLIRREARPSKSGKDDPCGEQSGRLLLAYSSQIPEGQKKHVKELFANLTWMLFHLGGVGQGARRPCYSRHARDRAPWWRGSTPVPETDSSFWELPETPGKFQRVFQKRLRHFFAALERIAGREAFDLNDPLPAGRVSRDRWTEAVDANCRIVACDGSEDAGKPFALAVLHSRDLKVRDRRQQLDYDPNLCGGVRGGVKPSPVWIADLDDYQVVTIFGATQDPRRRYASELRRQASPNQFFQIWPFA